MSKLAIVSILSLMLLVAFGSAFAHNITQRERELHLMPADISFDYLVSYNNEALELAIEFNDSSHLANAMTNMGKAYQLSGVLDSALYFMKQGLELRTLLRHDRGIASSGHCSIGGHPSVNFDSLSVKNCRIKTATKSPGTRANHSSARK